MADRLFDVPPKLTDRQAFVLEELVRSREGLYAEDVGAMLHARAGKHQDYHRCQWCSKDANGVLRALRQKGLAKRRRAGLWQATRVGRGAGDDTGPGAGLTATSEPLSRHPEPYDPSTAPIPF